MDILFKKMNLLTKKHPNKTGQLEPTYFTRDIWVPITPFYLGVNPKNPT
jgi:hypothetical protein